MDKLLFKRWIAAIRRDKGKYFNVTEYTRVCSRHFTSNDNKYSLTGRKKTLKDSAVPSVFPLKKEKQVRRKPPKKRFQTRPINQQTSSAAIVSAPPQIDDEVENLPPTNELIGTTNGQSDNNNCEEYNSEYVELKMENRSLREELARALDLQAELQSKIKHLEHDFQSKVFTVQKFAKSDKDISFYTGFPSVQIFESIYEFLDPGERGKTLFIGTRSQTLLYLKNSTKIHQKWEDRGCWVQKKSTF